MSRVVAIVFAAFTAAGLTTGCGSAAFTKPNAVSFVFPRDMQFASVPLTVRWTSHVARAPGTTFGLFVDVRPVHPGQSLRALGDPLCRQQPTCPDVAWLNRHNVYLTKATSLELVGVPPLGTPPSEPEVHRLTLIVLDKSWRRVGEAAYQVSFRLERPVS